jgi:hypothetical protein
MQPGGQCKNCRNQEIYKTPKNVIKITQDLPICKLYRMILDNACYSRNQDNNCKKFVPKLRNFTEISNCLGDQTARIFKT